MPSDLELPVDALPSASNLSFVEKLYYDFLNDPTSVGESWRRYFEALPRPPVTAPIPDGFPRRRAATRAEAGPDASFQAKVDKLVLTYREFGHLRARLDPLELVRPVAPIQLDQFGLSEADLDRPVADPDASNGTRTLRELVARLEETYCRSIGVELAHLHDADLRAWLQNRMERTRNRVTLAPDVKRMLLRKVI
ncbi:MAG TPA: hypothetical protein VD838_22435 [Anaeromyxobacteraceae bacterium]|nr:hypothetical protein [Anaeromyxobacteraceae bacterium]